MHKWLKKFSLDKNTIKNSSRFGKLKKYLEQPALWHLNRESVARGVAVGLFAAAIPFIPFQTIIAVFFAILIQANLPVTLAVSWVSNPLTIVPLTYLTSAIGYWILGDSQSRIEIVAQKYLWPLSHQESIWTAFSNWMLQFGRDFFVGLPVIAIGSAVIGYLLVNMIWHLSDLVKQYFKNKK